MKKGLSGFSKTGKDLFHVRIRPGSTGNLYCPSGLRCGLHVGEQMPRMVEKHIPGMP